MVSVLGSSVAPLALAAALAEGRHGGMRIAMVLAAEYVLYLVAMPVMGLIVDRASDLRAVLVVSQLTAACSQLVQAALIVSGVTAVAPLAAAAGMGAVAASLSVVTGARLVPNLLNPGLLQQANGLLRTVQMTLAVLGPATAGVLIAVLDAGWLIAWDAVTFLLAATIFTHLPRHPTVSVDGEPVESTHTGQDKVANVDAPVTLTAGLRAFAARRWLVALTLSEAVADAAFMCALILGPVHAARELGGIGHWGWINSALAAGSAIGALAAVLVHIDRAGWAIASGQAGLSLGIAAMAADIPMAGITAATAAGAAVAGPGDVARRSVVQTHVPHRQLGRVVGHIETIGSIPVPLAYLAAGHAADSIGTRPVIAACAATMLAVAIAPLMLPGVRRLRLTPEPPVSGAPRH
ncbi:MFS transporter [Actinomadura algeriensis]|uniref:MFS family permease n=1 Tax=Actinomadura algeriensis TaxID=1679523 RepID=A0ABR9JIJ6_9ACTN|nr:MFS transporter [Actinomadura algeriensis]MBE1530376.1 MFS family permease [Actinomadura algeriensis]